MEIHVLPDAEAAAKAVAAHIAARVVAGEAHVLGLATGRSPIRIYADLVARVQAGSLSLAGVKSFNLDEYLGLGAADTTSFRSYMEQHLFSRVALAEAHVPDGLARDPQAEALAYERAIAAAGGIDLQLLGIGQNGHIGFNEPGSDLASRTRVVKLTASTLAANAPDFGPGQSVPPEALTMGIGTIMEAREIVLIATGAAKAAALVAALKGPVSPDCPASALQGHAAVHVFADPAAAARLG